MALLLGVSGGQVKRRALLLEPLHLLTRNESYPRETRPYGSYRQACSQPLWLGARRALLLEARHMFRGSVEIQGYLAHTKQRRPRTLQ